MKKFFVRSRFEPFVAVTLAWLWGWFWAALVARPLVALTRVPQVDEARFLGAGSLFLLEWVRLEKDELGRAFVSLLPFVLVTPLALLPARALLLRAATRRAHSKLVRSSSGASTGSLLASWRLPQLTLHLLVFVACFLALALTTVLGAAPLRDAFFDQAGGVSWRAAAPFALSIALLVNALLLAHDTSAVDITRGQSIGDALQRGFSLAGSPGWLLGRALKALLGLGLVAFGVLVSTGAPTRSATLELVATQSIAWSLLVLDYFWFRIIARRHPPDGRSARDDVPRDPTPSPDA